MTVRFCDNYIVDNACKIEDGNVPVKTSTDLPAMHALPSEDPK